MADTAQTSGIYSFGVVSSLQTSHQQQTADIVSVGLVGVEFPATTGTVTSTGVVSSEQHTLGNIASAGVVSSLQTSHQTTTGSVVGTGVVGSDQFTANDANIQYELHVGTDEVQLVRELTATDRTPDETFTGLPHTTTLTLAAGTHYAVLQRRNKYGLRSRNVNPTRFDVNASTEDFNAPPSPPFNFRLVRRRDNVVRATANYYEDQDANRATKWLVYLTTDGGDPQTATPTVVEMSGGTVEKLIFDTAQLTGGTMVRARLKTRRIDAPDPPLELQQRDSEFTEELMVTIVVQAANAPEPVGAGQWPE